MSKIHELQKAEKQLEGAIARNPRDRLAQQELKDVRQLIENYEKNRPLGSDGDNSD